MLLLTIFGGVALVLAAIGIYGLMAYSVEQRTQEMGIRMALGADRATIRKLVVWQGMRLALVGVVLGMGAAFGLTRLIASFLFGVKSWDPVVFITVPIDAERGGVAGCLAAGDPGIKAGSDAGVCAWSEAARSGLLRRPQNEEDADEHERRSGESARRDRLARSEVAQRNRDHRIDIRVAGQPGRRANAPRSQT